MGNKTVKIYKGVLENAGLGEVAFYLKKAKTYLSYSLYALDNTDFKDVTSKSKSINKKIELLKNTILEIDNEIDDLGLELANEVEEINEEEE